MTPAPFPAATAVALLLASTTALAGPEPTHRDVRYSKKYERSVLDFWKAESEKATPLVVYFHGGGFRAGDKSRFNRNKLLSRNLPKGISFSSVNYPFLKDAGYLAILRHCGEAIRFLRGKAETWNIDTERIAVAGSSAGCLIAEYLAYTLPGISACYGIAQPMGTDKLVLHRIRKGGPPLILYSRSGPDDKVHHPDNARMVKAKCDKVGIRCEMWGSKKNDLPQLPQGTSIDEQVMKFFAGIWKIRLPER